MVATCARRGTNEGPGYRIVIGIVEEELILPDAVHEGIVMDTPSRREFLQHPVESDAVVPATFYEVVEAVSPEGGPITVHLDDEDPGSGLEAGPEDIWSRFAELAGKKKIDPITCSLTGPGLRPPGLGAVSAAACVVGPRPRHAEGCRSINTVPSPDPRGPPLRPGPPTAS